MAHAPKRSSAASTDNRRVKFHPYKRSSEEKEEPERAGSSHSDGDPDIAMHPEVPEVTHESDVEDRAGQLIPQQPVFSQWTIDLDLFQQTFGSAPVISYPLLLEAPPNQMEPGHQVTRLIQLDDEMDVEDDFQDFDHQTQSTRHTADDIQSLREDFHKVETRVEEIGANVGANMERLVDLVKDMSVQRRSPRPPSRKKNTKEDNQGSDDDVDVTPSGRKKKSTTELLLQEKARKYIAPRLGMGKDGKGVPPPADAETQNHILQSKTLPETFSFDWVSTPFWGPFNLLVVKILAQEMHHKLVTNVWMECNNTVELSQFETACRSRAESLRRTFKKEDAYRKANAEIQEELDAEAEALKIYAQHAERRSKLFDKRAAAIGLDPQATQDDAALLQKLGNASMSSDEYDSADEVKTRSNMKAIEKEWRSDSLRRWLWSWDPIWQAADAMKKNHGGSEMRKRKRSTKVNTSAIPPRGLPRNCYDEGWLKAGEGVAREILLQVQPPFTFDLRIRGRPYLL